MRSISLFSNRNINRANTFGNNHLSILLFHCIVKNGNTCPGALNQLTFKLIIILSYLKVIRSIRINKWFTHPHKLCEKCKEPVEAVQDCARLQVIISMIVPMYYLFCKKY